MCKNCTYHSTWSYGRENTGARSGFYNLDVIISVGYRVKKHRNVAPIKDLTHIITADNRKEFAKHQEIAKDLKIYFYFCKPYNSWERGANKNTNGLIRQYIPKETDFSEITNKIIVRVED